MKLTYKLKHQMNPGDDAEFFVAVREYSTPGKAATEMRKFAHQLAYHIIKDRYINKLVACLKECADDLNEVSKSSKKLDVIDPLEGGDCNGMRCRKIFINLGQGLDPSPVCEIYLISANYSLWVEEVKPSKELSLFPQEGGKA